MTPDKLLQKYRVTAALQGRCSVNTQPRRANRAHDKLHRILRRMVDTGVDQWLMDLLDDPDPWVQLWAATHSLELDVEKALAKLRELETRDDIIGLDAKYTIQEWQAGNLKWRDLSK